MRRLVSHREEARNAEATAFQMERVEHSGAHSVCKVCKVLDACRRMRGAVEACTGAGHPYFQASS